MLENTVRVGTGIQGVIPMRLCPPTQSELRCQRCFESAEEADGDSAQSAVDYMWPHAAFRGGQFMLGLTA